MNSSQKAFSLIELSIVLVIIGLLVAGIVGGQQLVSSARLTSARAATSSSPVNTVEGLNLWLETTSLSSFNASEAVNGSTVSTWYDINSQSTLRTNVAQNNSTYMPTYATGVANGLPALQYSGAQSLGVSVLAGQLVGPTEATIFLVQNDTDITKFSSTIFWSAGGYQLNVHALWDSVIYWDFGVCCGATGRMSATPTDFTNKWNIVSLTHKSDGTATIRVNGVILATSTSMTTAIQTGISGSFYVGAEDHVGSVGFKGYIAEVIFYSRCLNSFEIGQIETYLSKKWKIPISSS